MIGHGQYGNIQYGERSKTWLSSGEKTSLNVNPTTSSLFSSGDDIATPTDCDLDATITTDVGDAIDFAQVVGEDYVTLTTSDTGNATDLSSSSSLLLSPVQAIGTPLSVDGLFTEYNYARFESSELATSIQKAIGSQQYGDFQWGAISVGRPTGGAVPTEYLFTPTETSDIGDSVIRSPSVELNWSVQRTVDTGFATEIPDSIPWNYGISTGLGLVIQIGDAIKVNIFADPVLANEISTAIDLVSSTQENYKLLDADGTGIGIDDVQVVDWNYSPVVQDEIGNTTLDVSPTDLTLVPVTTVDKGWILSEGQPTGYDLSVLSSDVISSVTEQSSSTNIVYDPILVISEGWVIETIIITHDFNSEIIHNEQ